MEDSDEDPMLIEQLIAGLPHVYSKELRLSMAGKKHTVSGCLDMIRALQRRRTHLMCRLEPRRCRDPELEIHEYDARLANV